MKNHHVEKGLRPSRLAERLVRERDWPLRDAGSAAHHALSLIELPCRCLGWPWRRWCSPRHRGAWGYPAARS